MCRSTLLQTPLSKQSRSRRNEISKQRWVNPYKLQLNDFPDRLFPFEDFERDRESVCARIAAARRDTAGAVYCEIGSGSGNHLLGLAERYPRALVLGFELRFKRAVRTVQKAEARKLENVGVLRLKGERIDAVFPQASVDGLFVNFPEPWDRPRHRKHRVLSPRLLGQADELLAEGGFISVKTDRSDYLADFLEQVRRHGRFLIAKQTSDLYQSEHAAESIPTEFECLFRDKGVPIHYLQLRRIELR